MRVLIDCNVLVSAAISGGVCLRAISEAIDNHTVLVSEDILGEYRRVAGYTKFSQSTKTKMHLVIEEVALRAECVSMPDSPPSTEDMVDAKDLIYVIAAHVAEADIGVKAPGRTADADDGKMSWHGPDLRPIKDSGSASGIRHRQVLALP